MNCVSIKCLDYANNCNGVLFSFLKKFKDPEMHGGFSVIYFVNIRTKLLVNLTMKWREKIIELFDIIEEIYLINCI